MEDQLEELKAEQQKQSENLSEGRIGNKVKAKKEEIDYLIVLLNSVGKGKKKDKDELKAKLQNRKEQLEDLEAKQQRQSNNQSAAAQSRTDVDGFKEVRKNHVRPPPLP